MNDVYESNRQELTEYIRKVEYLKSTLNSLLYWDKITQMPAGGIEYRSKVMGFLGEELYKMLASERLMELIRYFEGNSRNDKITDATIKKLSRSAMYTGRIPQGEYRDYIQLVANAEQVWETAQKENNFLLIQPYLERLLSHYRNFAKCWGYEANPYDGWLGYYEEGFDSQRMEELIAIIKPEILGLLEKIQEKEKAKKADAEGQGEIFEHLPSVPLELQMELTRKLLSTAGFSFERGRVDRGAHCTILACAPTDVRLVTSVNEGDLKSCIFNAMYLAGKGLYQQDIDDKLLGTMLAEVSSFALEEGVGRLYEHGIGRSHTFWDYFTPLLQEQVPQLREFDSDQLFAEVNRINVTPVRLEADELTYMLHIIIRCELEQELMDGRLSVDQLPEAWNSKYREYLKVEPKDHGEGVLQDIHWFAGYFGYFASYLFAGLVSAQFAYCIERDSEGFEEASAEERFLMFHKWLAERVSRFGGTYTSAELIQKACGEPLKADYYVEYLKRRFSGAYKLEL